MARPALLVAIAVLCLVLGYQLSTMELSGKDAKPRARNGRYPSPYPSPTHSHSCYGTDISAAPPAPSETAVVQPLAAPFEEKEVTEFAAEEVVELAMEGITMTQIMKGYYASPVDCPDTTNPILDISHNTDAKHGDVCRNTMPKWHTWSCPVGCKATQPATKAPYCTLAYGEPCRIEAPVACVTDSHDGKSCRLKTN